jgi:hypothetical protein
MIKTIQIAGEYYKIHFNFRALATFGDIYRLTFTQCISLDISRLTMSQYADLLRCGLMHGDPTSEKYTRAFVDNLIESTEVPELTVALAEIYTEHVIAYFGSKEEKNPEAPVKGKK